MKKKSLKSLKLNKNSVSNLGDLGLQGGNDRTTIFGDACGGGATNDHLDNTCIGVSCNACQTDVGCGGGTGGGGGVGTTGNHICDLFTITYIMY